MENNVSEMMKFLCDRYIQIDPGLKEGMDEERWHNDIAQIIYDLRTQSGMSQKELAIKAGISESDVEKIEDADYDGNVIDMFRKIIAAMDKKIEIRVVA